MQRSWLVSLDDGFETDDGAIPTGVERDTRS